jgi:hypothetical protein
MRQAQEAAANTAVAGLLPDKITQLKNKYILTELCLQSKVFRNRLTFSLMGTHGQ